MLPKPGVTLFIFNDWFFFVSTDILMEFFNRFRKGKRKSTKQKMESFKNGKSYWRNWKEENGLEESQQTIYGSTNNTKEAL